MKSIRCRFSNWLENYFTIFTNKEYKMTLPGPDILGTFDKTEVDVRWLLISHIYISFSHLDIRHVLLFDVMGKYKKNTSTNKTSVESLFLPMKRRTLGTGQQRTFDSCRLWLHPLYLSIHLTKGHKGNGQFQRIKLSSTNSHWYIACFNRVLEVYMLIC